MVAIIFGNDMREERRIPGKIKEADPYGQPPYSYCTCFMRDVNAQ